MRVGEFIVIDAHRQCHAHQPLVILDGDLAIGKFLDQAINGVLRPGTADVIVDRVHQPFELWIVLLRQVTKIEMQVVKGHGVSLRVAEQGEKSNMAENFTTFELIRISVRC